MIIHSLIGASFFGLHLNLHGLIGPECLLNKTKRVSVFKGNTPIGFVKLPLI
jgi:hypothetical protein